MEEYNNINHKVRHRTSFIGWTNEEIREHKKLKQSIIYKKYYERKQTEKKRLMAEREDVLNMLSNEMDDKECDELCKYLDALEEVIVDLPFN